MSLKDTMMNTIIIKNLKKHGKEKIARFDAASLRAVEENKALMMRILHDCKDTEYGKKYHFADIRNVDDYRKNVPMTTYSDYEEYIDRMTVHGEKNLLSAYPVVYYASTSGTSGSPKKIPVSDHSLELFRELETAFKIGIGDEYCRNALHRPCNIGKALVLLSFSKTMLPDGTPFGSISAAALDEKSLELMKYFITTPKEAVISKENVNLNYINARYGIAEPNVTILTTAYIPAMVDLMNYIKKEWKMLVDDIRNGTIDSSITMPDELRRTLTARLRPNPQRADELTREFEKGFDSTIMRRIWPNLDFIASIWAGNFRLYARKLQEFSGRSIPYFTASYVSSEGIFAVARHPFDQSYNLIPYSCFFEFIPQDGERYKEDDENPQTVLMDELEEGKEYEVVITNQSGFYRYRMGDVVRVTGFYNETPQVEFKFRKKNVVSIAGEKFTEDHLLTSIREFERRSDVRVTDYCMYPDRDCAPGRYVVLIEPDTDVDPARVEEYADILSEEFTRASTSYAHYVHGGNMGRPKVIFLQKETFQLQRELKMYRFGLSENQLKTVRVLTTPEQIKFFTTLKECESK